MTTTVKNQSSVYLWKHIISKRHIFANKLKRMLELNTSKYSRECDMSWCVDLNAPMGPPIN